MSPRYARRTWVDRNRPRVLDVAPGLVHESGPVRERDWAPQRVAVMAHWSTRSEPSRSVVTMLRELQAGGYDTVLVSAAEVPGKLGRVCTWAPGQPVMPEVTTVLRRANVGYDFGSWGAVLQAFRGIRRAHRVVLVNDSLIGPFSPLSPLLADFEASSTPVWGLSGSLQHRPHIQSFFVGYRDGVLDSATLRAFWADIRVESRKAKVVRYYELGLSEALDEAGIAWRTMFSPDPRRRGNPTLTSGGQLVDERFPFVKANASAYGSELPTRVGADEPADWFGGDDRAPSPALRGVGRLRFHLDVEGLRGVRPPRLSSVPLGPLRDSEIT